MKTSYHFISSNEFLTFFREARSQIFGQDFDFDIDKVLTEQEQKARSANWRKVREVDRYHLVAKLEGAIIGWSFGLQTSGDDFYMVNSAVFPAFRRKGIYMKMMELAVEKIRQMGYQRIYSRHKMANNAILIPKLKFGFTITGFDVNDIFGNMVVLSYYTNPRRRELLEVRMGSRKIEKDVLKLVKE